MKSAPLSPSPGSNCTLFVPISLSTSPFLMGWDSAPPAVWTSVLRVGVVPSCVCACVSADPGLNPSA